MADTCKVCNKHGAYMHPYHKKSDRFCAECRLFGYCRESEYIGCATGCGKIREYGVSTKSVCFECKTEKDKYIYSISRCLRVGCNKPRLAKTKYCHRHYNYHYNRLCNVPDCAFVANFAQREFCSKHAFYFDKRPSYIENEVTRFKKPKNKEEPPHNYISDYELAAFEPTCKTDVEHQSPPAFTPAAQPKLYDTLPACQFNRWIKPPSNIKKTSIVARGFCGTADLIKQPEENPDLRFDWSADC
jgi:hypothetical protein